MFRKGASWTKLGAKRSFSRDRTSIEEREIAKEHNLRLLQESLRFDHFTPREQPTPLSRHYWILPLSRRVGMIPSQRIFHTSRFYPLPLSPSRIYYVHSDEKPQRDEEVKVDPPTPQVETDELSDVFQHDFRGEFRRSDRADSERVRDIANGDFRSLQ